MISLTQMEGLSEFAPTLEGVVHMYLYITYICMQIMSRNALLIFDMDNISGPSQTPVNMSVLLVRVLRMRGIKRRVV